MDKITSREFHKHTFQNREEIERSTMCGCASCGTIFPAKDVVDYFSDTAGDTAVCPECAIDAVIGDACGLPVNEQVMRQLNKAWF